jgi:hypothetical protein
MNTPDTLIGGSLKPVGSAHLVDCNAYGKELVEYQTISQALDDNRIVSVTKEPDGRFQVTERCDDYFSGYLTREQLLAWADELRALAGAPNGEFRRTDPPLKP